MRHVCKCGQEFDKRRMLIEHIALQNPQWPRSSPEDKHGVDMQVNKNLFTFDDQPKWHER